ncbi:MAG: 4'-phosphopantetheinyl transferase superfamily protein [Oscillospiraceae bacterium]|nr:4'-phosphopantetheinyl transferase superfamily protein [Oscillospiraceae bacterium]
MEGRIVILPVSEVVKIPREYCEKRFPRRLARAERFVRKEDGLRCIGAGALIYGVLGIEEEDIIFNGSGKPYYRGDMYFNVSHSGDYVVMAADKDEIGIDIEKEDASRICITEKFFTKEEIDWISKYPKARFFRAWTMKESVMKAEGKGFEMRPGLFSVIPAICGEPLDIDGTLWYCDSFRIDGHRISVAARSKNFKPRKEIVAIEDILK